MHTELVKLCRERGSKNTRFYIFSADVQKTEVVVKGEKEGENL